MKLFIVSEATYYFGGNNESLGCASIIVKTEAEANKLIKEWIAERIEEDIEGSDDAELLNKRESIIDRVFKRVDVFSNNVINRWYDGDNFIVDWVITPQEV